jgi:methionyl-tRNA formyltransferase
VRLVFLGSPNFALPALRRLIESEHEVAAVVTQPDRPAGRGRSLRPPPVKELALARGLPVLQPRSVNTPDALDAIRAHEPEALMVAAFGQILKQPLLDLPARGSLNIHASLLPKYRGAAPVAVAILAGEAETGVTIMEVQLALDAGPIVAQRACAIEPDDTTGTLTAKLSELGADLLIDVLPAWGRREIGVRPQDDALATYVKVIGASDARIDWVLTAEDIWRRVRAYNPWPGATTTVDGVTLRILEAWPLDQELDVVPGTVVELPAGVSVPGAGFAVRAGRGLLAIVRAQRAGKRAVSGGDLLRGWRDLLGRRAE